MTITTTIKKIAVIIIAAFIISACASKKSTYQSSTRPDNTQNTYKFLTYNNKTFEYNSSVRTILIAGIDSYSFEGQTDFVAIVIFDRRNNNYTIVNIPREMVVEFELYDDQGDSLGFNSSYLNLVYPLSGSGVKGARQLIKTVSKLFNEIPIIDYLFLDLNFLSTIIKITGPVTVVLEDDSLSYLNPLWVKNYELTIDENNIDIFLNRRDVNQDFSAFDRRNRQNIFLSEIIKKMYFMQTDQNSFETVIGNSVTNLNLNDLCFYKEMLETFSFSETKLIDGEYKKTEYFDEFIPDKNKLNQLTINLFYKD